MRSSFMPISPNDAELALRDIDHTSHASATFYGYRRASPHLILWGLIWLLGYGSDFLFGHHPLTWPFLTALGASGSAWQVWRRARTKAAGGGWQYAATGFAVC